MKHPLIISSAGKLRRGDSGVFTNYKIVSISPNVDNPIYIDVVISFIPRYPIKYIVFNLSI